MVKDQSPFRFVSRFLVAFVVVTVMAGCGERLEQMMKLNEFELPNDRPKSSAYRSMMSAYYRTNPADASDEDRMWIKGFDATALTGDREIHLREMYEIQSIEKGERVFGSFSCGQVWVALTPQAKIALKPWME